MNLIERINPMIASLENTLGECIASLYNPDVDVEMVASAIRTVQQALSKLRPVIGQLVQIEDEQSTELCNISSLIIELLVSLDETTANYCPRSHAENVALIYDALDCFKFAPPPDNVVDMPVKKEVH